MSPWILAAIGGAALIVGVSGLFWTAIVGPDPARKQAVANLHRGFDSRTATSRRSSSAAATLERVVHRFATPGVTGYFEKLIMRAGKQGTTTVDGVLVTKLILTAVVVLVTGLVALSARSPLAVLLAILASVLAFFTPDLLLASRGMERRQVMTRTLPDTLDQMSIAVEAGLGFDAAMIRVARRGHGVLAEELVRTLQDIQVGQPRREAYEALGHRTGVRDLRRFMRSVVQAETYGIALADVLHTQADELRVQRRQRAEHQAMQIPVKVVFPLILFILPVLFIVVMGPSVISLLETLQ